MEAGMKALTVCCLKQGTKYGPERVNVLYNMVSRNLSLHYDFICHTDDDSGINPVVECYPIEHGLTGWWGKMNLYQERPLGVETERILFLDLDVVITGSLDDLVRFPSHHAMIRDYPVGMYPPQTEKSRHGNSSIILMTRGRMVHIWKYFLIALGVNGTGVSQQGFINRNFQRDVDLLQDAMCRSYKMHQMNPHDAPGENCRVVMFHGKPKPWDFKAGWIAENYR
jgi:hypothetical protein